MSLPSHDPFLAGAPDEVAIANRNTQCVVSGDATPAFSVFHRLTFTGSGKEYFRIWIVNLCLSVATLGIYSAWAKVRRLQYFDRNTMLAGAVFDFDGNPKAILRGRVIALALLAVYHYAFGFSVNVGLAVVGALLLSLPFMMRGALRFRLRNTRYRGLRFDFGGEVGGAYLCYVPAVLVFLLPGALSAIGAKGKDDYLALAGVLALLTMGLYLLWPLIHGFMKRYQHRHLRFGGAQADYTLPARRLYRPYLISVAISAAGIMVGAILLSIFTDLFRHSQNASVLQWLAPALMALLGLYLFYLVMGPFLQVRVSNLAWSATTFPNVAIHSDLEARAMIKLQSMNVLLTLLTLGLYRPFGVVRLYQYRLAHIMIETRGDFEQVAAGASHPDGGAAHDSAADFLGLDLSW